MHTPGCTGIRDLYGAHLGNLVAVVEFGLEDGSIQGSMQQRHGSHC